MSPLDGRWPAAPRDLYNALVRWARRACGDDGEDVVHECLTRMREKHVFEAGLGEEALRRTAFGFAHNVARELFRSRRRERAAGALPESWVNVDLATVFALRAAFLKLEPEAQELLWLVDVEGCQQKELAARWNVPDGTLRCWVTRARKELRQSLSSYAPRGFGNEGP